MANRYNKIEHKATNGSAQNEIKKAIRMNYNYKTYNIHSSLNILLCIMSAVPQKPSVKIKKLFTNELWQEKKEEEVR